MLTVTLAAVLLAALSSPTTTVLAPGEHLETSVVASGDRVVAAAIRRATADQPAWIDVFVSDDRAATWSAPIRMTATFDGNDYAFETDPTLTVFDDGTFGLAFLALEYWPVQAGQDPERLVFMRSSDGRQWSEPQVLLAGTYAGRLPADRPFLAFDRSHATAYMTYTSSTSGQDQLMLTSSTDRGAHWSPAVAVSATSHITPAQLTVTANGTLVVVGFDNQSLVRVVSTNGGTSWSDVLTIGTEIGIGVLTPVSGTQSPPLTNMASWHEHAYCVYPSKNGVFFTYSTDDGLSWSAPRQVGGATGDAALPSIAVDDVTGDVFVSWLDGRDDVARSGTLRLYGARFTGNGTMTEAPRAFSESFTGGGLLGDIIGSVAIGAATVVTAFSTSQDLLAATRMQFLPPPRRRAVGK
jgi:BNR repeat-like domain